MTPSPLRDALAALDAGDIATARAVLLAGIAAEEAAERTLSWLASDEARVALVEDHIKQLRRAVRGEQ